MAIALSELATSPRVTSGENASAEYTLTLTGTSDNVEATVYLDQNLPAIDLYGLIRHSFTIDPEWVDETQNDGRWNVTVRYQRWELPTVDSSTNFTTSFDTTGGTQHITQSLETISAVTTKTSQPVTNKAIGNTPEGVEGTDIVVPVFQFSETYRFSAFLIDAIYRRNLFWLTGQVNNAPFRGFEKGECLFLGASGSKIDASTWELTYTFAASPNRASFAVGAMTVPSKEGWHYMWVRYEKSTDVGSNLVMTPVAVNIERVYEYGDFSYLGIGVS